MRNQSVLNPVIILALFGGHAPFFFSYASSSSVTADGVTTSSYIDYVALLGGSCAVLLGIIGLVAGLKASNKLLGVGLSLFAMGLGVFQLLRGIGML